MTASAPASVRVVGQVRLAVVQPPEDREWDLLFTCSACDRTLGAEGGVLLYERPFSAANTSSGIYTVHYGPCLEYADPTGRLWRRDLGEVCARLAANTTKGNL